MDIVDIERHERGIVRVVMKHETPATPWARISAAALLTVFAELLGDPTHPRHHHRIGAERFLGGRRSCPGWTRSPTRRKAAGGSTPPIALPGSCSPWTSR